MEISSTKSELLNGIQKVQNVVSPKTVLPILSNVLVETTKEGIRLTATDLEIGISATISADVRKEGAVTVPARRFSDIIKELPNTEIALSVAKNNVMTIKTSYCIFKIMGLGTEEFPKLPEFNQEETVVISQALLKEMLNMTAFAISHDETRYVLNGILFAFTGNKLRLVATDGRRLAMIERDIPAANIDKKEFIVPTKTVYELIRILSDEGDLRISIGKSQILFNLGGTLLISRLIDGEFPNYERVIPPQGNKKLVVDKEGLLTAVRRANILTTQDSRAVKVDLQNERMIISRNTPGIGEVREELGVQYKGEGMTIGFNPVYLIDGLKAISDEEISFELYDSEKPGVIRIGDSYLYLVLPMQVN